MFNKLLAGVFAAAMVFAAPPAEAHSRFGRVPARVINSYQRDVRQFQRHRTRSVNQFSRSFDRNFGRGPVRHAPRSNAVFLGSPRSGVYFRF